MADFRTKLLGLAGAAIVFSGMAFGQVCSTGTASSAPVLTSAGTNNIRSEGLTELLPVITVTCANAGAIPTASFNLLVQVPGLPITSAVTNTSTGITEIALNAVSGGAIASTVFGTISNGVVTFSNVSVTGLANAVNLVLSVSNVRVNASSLTSSGAFPTSVSAVSFVSGITNTTSGTSNSLIVAYALSALTPASKVYSGVTYGNTNLATHPTALTGSGNITTNSAGAVTSSPSYAVCASNNTGSSSNVGPAFYVAVIEAFNGAFKNRSDETGGGAGAAVAASGTRIKLVFNNVPAGVALYVPTTALTFTTTAATAASSLVATLTTSETGAFTAASTVTSPSPVSGLSQLIVNGTSASAIYEITADNTTAVDELVIPVSLVSSSNGLTNYLTNPTMTVTTSLAPQLATASQVPSFATTASDIATANTVTFTSCVTNLLFPFVTNANGFETGIAISNTTKDPFKTAAQSGTCTLNYYQSGVSGATNPTAVTAPNLAEGANQPYLSGESYAFTLTQSLAVNASNPATFQGYIIAQCNFVDAHAFAYILGGLQPGMFVNPTNTAMGYLALVLNSRSQVGAVDSTSF
jgi:hypothetical protein